MDGGPRRLQGTPKNPGLFPGGAGGVALGRRALAEGLVAMVTAPAAGGKKAAPVLVTLTDKGRQFVLDADSPAKLLGALREGLDARGAALAAEVQSAQARLDALGKQTEELRH